MVGSHLWSGSFVSQIPKNIATQIPYLQFALVYTGFQTANAEAGHRVIE